MLLEISVCDMKTPINSFCDSNDNISFHGASSLLPILSWYLMIFHFMGIYPKKEYRDPFFFLCKCAATMLRSESYAGMKIGRQDAFLCFSKTFFYVKEYLFLE